MTGICSMTANHEELRWYDLFSRGARDWLRHNQKMREQLLHGLPRILSQADSLGNLGNRKVQIPVKVLEHYRFRLNQDSDNTGVGQGQVTAGDVLRPADRQRSGGGGNEDGGLEFRVEMKIDEVVEWLWQELALPDLKPKHDTAMDDDDWVREGLDKKGPRARLDRRRTMREAIKRRSSTGSAAAIINDDLRFRQLRRRPTPATQAVCLFGLDASGSMGNRERQLAKSFFFWALEGVRRQYPKLEGAFVAHTVEAWEFSEEEFFQVAGQGGTVASACFNRVASMVAERFDPSRYNIYFFYASDGENFSDDREAATAGLRQIASAANYMGYVEVGSPRIPLDTETGRIFADVIAEGGQGAGFAVQREEDVFEAIRVFFSHEAAHGVH